MSMRSLLLLMALACVPIAPASADSKHVSKDPIAREIYDDMGRFLSGLQSFSVKAERNIERQHTGGKWVKEPSTVELAVLRPDRMRLLKTSKKQTYEALIVGRDVSFINIAARKYSIREYKGTLGQIAARLMDDMDEQIPTVDLVFSSQELFKAAETVRYLGRAKIDGIPCDRLAFGNPVVDWELWITQGPKPFPKKISLTNKRKVSWKSASATFQWSMKSFKNWDFGFVAPKGSIKVKAGTEFD